MSGVLELGRPVAPVPGSAPRSACPAPPGRCRSSPTGWRRPGRRRPGALSPYLRGHITRFGAYATDELGCHPEAFNPMLKEVDFTALSLAA
jgi:hypothetical protein